MEIRVADYIGRAALAPAPGHLAPWDWTRDAPTVIQSALSALGADYRIARSGDVAVHVSATVEDGAQIKGPAIIGPHCLVARTALIRGGCWLDAACIIGPACELKTSYVFEGAKLAHLNFVGDSVIGAGANIEAGAMIANCRNERADKRIRIRSGGTVIDTGAEKFGALVGDGARIGANAVIAPGALLAPGAIVARLSLIDQGEP